MSQLELPARRVGKSYYKAIDWQALWDLHKGNIVAIADEVGCSWNTARKYLEERVKPESKSAGIILLLPAYYPLHSIAAALGIEESALVVLKATTTDPPTMFVFVSTPINIIQVSKFYSQIMGDLTDGETYSNKKLPSSANKKEDS
jgi:hypothetical protein